VKNLLVEESFKTSSNFLTAQLLRQTLLSNPHPVAVSSIPSALMVANGHPNSSLYSWLGTGAIEGRIRRREISSEAVAVDKYAEQASSTAHVPPDLHASHR